MAIPVSAEDATEGLSSKIVVRFQSLTCQQIREAPWKTHTHTHTPCQKPCPDGLGHSIYIPLLGQLIFFQSSSVSIMIVSLLANSKIFVNDLYNPVFLKYVCCCMIE